VSKAVHGHQGWRLITCMWLHAGVVHLLINMLCLLFIGIRLEQEFGFGKFFFHPNLPPSNEGNIFFKIVLHTFCIKQESRIAFVQSDLGEAKIRHVTKMLFSTISTYRLYALGSTAPPPKPRWM
jgi:hypothetical protein